MKIHLNTMIHYEGRNLTVPAYTIYKSSSTSSHIIRPSTVFKIVKNLQPTMKL